MTLAFSRPGFLRFYGFFVEVSSPFSAMNPQIGTVRGKLTNLEMEHLWMNIGEFAEN